MVAADSAVEGMSSMTSVDSSIYNFVSKNGRTYHKYRAGKYMLQNDEAEKERLDIQHYLLLSTLGGKLHLAPFKVGIQNALDIATGTGIWATEFAHEYPSINVIGTDLSPIQPFYVPRNCEFEVDDMEDEWIYTHRFDYIHGRMLFSCFRDFPSVVNKAFAALNSGGYFELQDSLPMACFDESWNGTAIQRWASMILEGARKLRMDWAKVSKYKQWMNAAGFVDIKELSRCWPINTWPKHERHKLLGLWANKVIRMGLHGVSIEVLTAGLGMSSGDVDLLLEEVDKDLDNKSIHCYIPILVVYGRKP